ncbi:MAG TPA: TonB-dependent receptor [Bacteroidales bacterium]|nr:TonB-dependent receptor [Bacteroidales bacterium]HPT22256.1 TonB-dependent receptor [Bacteroidales bacterium]
MKKELFLSVIFNAIITIPGFAQQKKSISDTISIDEVIITGSKTSVNRNNVPLTVSVVSKEKIENSSESALLPVLTEQVPGLFVTERGITGFGVSTGSSGQISLRGIGGSPNTQVLILLNGNPQFMGIMGHPLPDAYEASDVEKVEVIRGPASTLYGTNAMGGVINIITKEQKEDGFKANARVMYGSYNTQKYMVNGGFRKDRFNVFASFNHDQTDGHRDSSDFKINNGYLRTGYDLNSHLNINADFSLAEFDATDPGPEYSKAGYTIDITRGMGAIALDNKYDKTNGSLRFFYNFGEHNITDGFHSRDKNYGIVLYQAFNPFKGNTVTAGIDYKQYGGIAENIMAMNGRGMVFSDTTVKEMAGYVYIQQELFTKLVLNTGFRLEHNSVFGYEPVPTAGLAYNLASTTTIKASVAKGFRSPTIRELYMWSPANDELKPERMMNYEIGVLQKLSDNKLSLELTLFRANGDNLIKTVTGTNGTKYQNTGEFTNTGIEFACSYRPIDKLTLNANYSYISMKEHIIASPEQQMFISGTYKWNKLAINLSMQHIHNLYTQITPKEEKVNYTLLNSRISYLINKYVDLFVKGENLTDKKYYINYAYPMPGIIVFGGINLHL